MPETRDRDQRMVPHEVWDCIGRKARVPARTPFKLRGFRVDGDGLTLGIDHVTPAKAFSLQA
jgi:hypothetical protein